jgi:predicted amidohydrolase YtcJ
MKNGPQKLFSISMLYLLILAACFILFLSCQRETPADLVLLNGNIVTVDDGMPKAQALAVTGDLITAAGSNKEMEKYISEKTEVLNLNGKFVIPGFIDGHAHFLGLGYAKMKLDLTKTVNWDQVINMVKQAVQQSRQGEWILGRGWHQEKWDNLPKESVEGYPVHDALSKISPENPVILTHASGHAIFVNAKAMFLAGITKSIPDPDGGRIVRKPNGGPSGVFLENAEELINSKYSESQAGRTPKQIEAEIIKAVNLASEECLKKGITSFQDAGQPFEIIDLFKRLADEKKLGIRLWVMIGEQNKKLKENISNYRLINYADNMLTVRAVKRYMDGALGARGAWLLEPYTDLPSASGLNTISLDEFRETAELAAANGFQLCTHAIGDRGNRKTLNIYEETFKKYPQKKDLRWRIEHAQHLHPDDIPRFGKLGVIAAMQGIHCISDGPWVPKRLGDKRSEKGAYVWGKLKNAGAVISNGTDAPVEDVDPIANYYALVTRKMKNGNAFYPAQAMSREDALKSYTLNCAYSAFEENIKGTITPGKIADITVLSQDLLSVSDDKILETKVAYTILGGKVRYKNPDL